MKLTVFTPTYNRAYTIPKLYESLCRQTLQDFKWLIVDDGSSDNTKQLVNCWLSEGKISIDYIFQENQGKAAAHNVGVENADGELFTCVDSDDYLTDDAVETILDCWNRIKSNHKYIGIVGKRKIVGNVKNSGIDDMFTACEGTLRWFYNNGLKGDTILIYKFDIIKKYKFPKFKNEKFVPEAYLYDLLDQEGVLYFLKKTVYIGEYLPDGYSASLKRINTYNPNGYKAYISQRVIMDFQAQPMTIIKNIITDMIRLISIDIVLKKTKDECRVAQNRRKACPPPPSKLYMMLYYVLYPFGFLRYCKDFRKFIYIKSRK